MIELPKDTLGKSPYKRGADDGLFFGILLCAMFFAGVFSFEVPLLGLFSFLLMLSVPFMIYRFLRRSYVTDRGATPLSSLWMQGIMTFACGCLIAGLVATIYLKWINPEFIITRLREVIEFYRDSPWDKGAETAVVLQRMIDNHLVPGPVSMVVEMIWLGIFSGSLLSVLMALLARARGIDKSLKKF
jgi:hypothetical protein